MFVSAKRTLATVAALAATTIALGFTANKAQAYNCAYGQGYQVCFEQDGYNEYGHTLWNVTMRNNYITENLRVACNGSRMTYWASRGGASQSEAAYIARWFCAL